MKIALEARRTFWPNIRRRGFRGIRTIADAYDKGNGRSIYARIEDMYSHEYYGLAAPPQAYMLQCKDWHLDVECKVHIGMTAQEKPAKRKISDKDKLDFIYLGVASLRNHSADVMKKLPIFLQRTQQRQMHDDPRDVLLVRRHGSHQTVAL